MGKPITSPELVQTLKECGYPVAGRRVTDWVAKGLLPPRVRLRRGPGGGRGALYGWSASEILLEALTVREALAVRNRADWASLASWFAGFDYPVDRMAHLW